MIAENRGTLYIPFTLFVIVLFFFLFVIVISTSTTVKVLSSLLSGGVLFLGGLQGYSLYNAPQKRLSRKLKSINSLLLHGSHDSLNSLYQELVQLYFQLPEHQQLPFAEKMETIQLVLEEQLRAKKKMEEILSPAQEISFSATKKKYNELLHHYHKLPSTVQKEYYHQVVHLREKLEHRK